VIEAGPVIDRARFLSYEELPQFHWKDGSAGMIFVNANRKFATGTQFTHPVLFVIALSGVDIDGY
jgi:hypothetical protein